MMETGLVLVCKRPKLGFGKQRLAASLGNELTLRVAEALLACAIEDACNWSGPIVIAPAEPLDYEWGQALSSQIPSPVTILPQAQGNLGRRLNILDQTLRKKGMRQLVFIGSDAPGLEAIDYVAVKESLQQHDTVLIPAVDGGVVLMASRIGWPELSDLPWSTAELGKALVRSCHVAGHDVVSLRQGYDVDEADDFIKLKEQLILDTRPARCALYQLVCDIIAMMPQTDNA
ncbi:MAG: DUF2064 domain-containing protein [Nitrosomonas sp.]|nr:DUF2064 domain-containing protein [Nitrosomonas sp.]